MPLLTSIGSTPSNLSVAYDLIVDGTSRLITQNLNYPTITGSCTDIYLNGFYEENSTIYFNTSATTCGYTTVTSTSIDGRVVAITYGSTGNYYSIGSHIDSPAIRAEIKKQDFLDKMRRSLSISPRRLGLESPKSPSEMKARDTLRDLISERDWRNYVMNGFLMIQGPSGKRYQVFNDQRRIRVFEGRENTYELCIHTDRQCPPTDHVLNLKLFIEFDEDSVWKASNATRMSAKKSHNVGDIIVNNDNILTGATTGIITFDGNATHALAG